jgi:putative membrane protein
MQFQPSRRKTMRKPHPSKTYLLGLALAGALFASTASHAQQAPAKSDSVHANDWAWMEKTARAGAFEVQAGQIASAKATNPKVREFADKMVADHTRANDELKAIASSKGITLPDQPDNTHKKELGKLQKLTAGSRFDEEYVARPGVIDHQDAVKHFKKGAKDVRDADVKAFAQKTLPTVEEHLSLAKKLNG